MSRSITHLRFFSLILGVLLMTLAGCNKDLNRKRAAELIQDRIVEIAPLATEQLKPQIMVDEIIMPDEFNREIRYRMMIPGVPDSMNREPCMYWCQRAQNDTFEVSSVYLQRNDRGWSVKRFAPKASAMLMLLANEDRYIAYRDIAGPAQTIDSVLTNWIADRWKTAENEWASTSDQEWYDIFARQARSGPTENELTALLQSKKLPPDIRTYYVQGDSVRWPSFTVSRSPSDGSCTLSFPSVGPEALRGISDLQDASKLACSGRGIQKISEETMNSLSDEELKKYGLEMTDVR